MTSELTLFSTSGERKYLNPAERRVFLATARTVESLASRTLCLTIFHTGCRISEALALRVHDLELDQRTITIRTLKQRSSTPKFRSVPIPRSLCQLLAEVTAEMTPEDRLWAIGRTKAWQTIKEVMESAGLEGIKATPKGLRHGYAIASVMKDIPLSSIQLWLGHRRLDTTQIYTLAVGNEARRLASRLWDSGDEF